MRLLYYLVLIVYSSTSLYAQGKKNALEIQEFTYNEKEQLKIYRVHPANYNPKEAYPALVIFHGGGWSMGDASWGFSTAKYYAEKGMVAFSVQYRLQDLDRGITPYESVIDAQNAIRWIRRNASELSIGPDKIAAFGWSAGAHLAACAAVFDNLGVSNEEISSAPNLLLLRSPALSLLSYANFQKRLLDKIEVKDLSPAEFVSEDTPPSLILIGRDDTVTPLKGSMTYKQYMDKYNNICKLVIYDGVGHLFTPSSEPDDGWPNPDKEVVIKAQKEMDDFLRIFNYIR